MPLPDRIVDTTYGCHWVESTFCKRVCNHFMPSNKDNARCCCGNLWQYHHDGSPATLRANIPNLHWSPSKHTILQPTDAYGTLEFHGGAHPSKAQYLRLSYDARPEDVIKLFTAQWGLELPKLLITVQGGKSNFVVPSQLRKVINKGLLRVSRTTAAWVLTSGMNSGVSHNVGEALASETSLRMRSGQVVSIGICPWGVVERRHELVGCNKEVLYHFATSKKSKFEVLNRHHRFFLLVDNGTSGKYGAEIVLRLKVEDYISRLRIEARGGLVTPAVCIVIEGGPQTIRQVLEYITNSPPIPVIVCDGTGRAADILAFVHKHMLSDTELGEGSKEVIVTMIMKVLELNRDLSEKLLIELMQCVKRKHLITIFRLKDETNFDETILSALLRSQHLNPLEQLSLALTWNRVDIARSQIFVDDVDWTPESLEQAMMDALVNDRTDFVKLLVEQGVIMKRFLSINRLEELYNTKRGPPNTLRYIVRDVVPNVSHDYKYTLLDIGLVINKLMGGAYRSAYTRRRFHALYESCRNTSAASPGSYKISMGGKNSLNSPLRMGRAKSVYDGAVLEFEYPFTELMVWSVLTKRQCMAKLMWQQGEEALAKALVAAKLYKSLAHEAADDDLETEVYQELRNYGKEFEKLALDVLDYCYQQNIDLTHQLLTYELRNMSKQTCMSLAVSVNHRQFLSHSSCQVLLADLWLGGLRTRKNTNLKVLLGLILPPTILYLGFRSQKELKTMPQTKQEHQYEEQGRSSDSESDEDAEEIVEPVEQYPYPEPSFSGSSLPIYLKSESDKSPNGTVLTPLADVAPSSNINESLFTLDSSMAFQHSRQLPASVKFYEFYNAPITKFWAHSMAYIVFLCCFTYLVLVRLPAEPEAVEYFVILYVITFLMENIREMFTSEPTQFRQKISVWAEKLWNLFDFIFSILFLLGFILRMQEDPLRSTGRVIYCFDVVYWYLRLLEILSANKYLGPLVAIMGKLLKNMMYFIVLLAVVLMSFGVCRQSILYPNEEASWWLAREIFYQPYFMLYGEVFAGEIDPLCGPDLDIKCEPGHWITPIVMSAYLLLANILLLNLLVAIFNNTFVSVNAISHQFWRFQRFQVVMEFEEKPVFPPPLIILSHTQRAFKFVQLWWRKKAFVPDDILKLFLEGENLERLHDFEEECVAELHNQKELKEQMTSEERIRLMLERSEVMLHRIEQMHTQGSNVATSISSFEFHIQQFEEMLQQSLLSNHRMPTSRLISESHSGINDFVHGKAKVDIKVSGASSSDEEDVVLRDRAGSRRPSFLMASDQVCLSEALALQRQNSQISRKTRPNMDVVSDDEVDIDQKGRLLEQIENVVDKNAPNEQWIINRANPPLFNMESTPISTSQCSSAPTHHNSFRRKPRQQLSLSGSDLPDRPRLTPVLLHPQLEQAERLRSAEECDFHLMEGIIRRRLRRDSQNLAASLEDLCSIRSLTVNVEEDGEWQSESDSSKNIVESRASPLDIVPGISCITEMVTVICEPQVMHNVTETSQLTSTVADVELSISTDEENQLATNFAESNQLTSNVIESNQRSSIIGELTALVDQNVTTNRILSFVNETENNVDSDNIRESKS